MKFEKNKEANNTSNLYLDVFSFFQANLILVLLPALRKQVLIPTPSYYLSAAISEEACGHVKHWQVASSFTTVDS